MKRVFIKLLSYIRDLDIAEPSGGNGALFVPSAEHDGVGFEQFESCIFSHEAGCIKPDPAIFDLAIGNHDLVPGETLYIDDLPENGPFAAVPLLDGDADDPMSDSTTAAYAMSASGVDIHV